MLFLCCRFGVECQDEVALEKVSLNTLTDRFKVLSLEFSSQLKLSLYGNVSVPQKAKILSFLSRL